MPEQLRMQEVQAMFRLVGQALPFVKLELHQQNLPYLYRIYPNRCGKGPTLVLETVIVPPNADQDAADGGLQALVGV